MKQIKPTLLAKYGTLVSCGALVLAALCAWFVPYPDVISTTAVLAGSQAPKPLIARQSSRIAGLTYKDGDNVRKGSIIGSLETTALIDDVLSLDAVLDSIYLCLQNDNVSGVKNWMSKDYNQLGELQAAYQALIQAYLPYKDYVAGNYAADKRSLLNKDLAIANRSRTVLDEQQRLNKEDITLSQTTLDRNKKLLEQQLISEEEYRNLTSQHIGKRLSEPQMKTSYINNESQANAIQKELIELNNQVNTQKALFQQALYSLKSQVSTWKQNFLLIAPENGILNFTSFLQVNQAIDAGKILAYIIPQNNSIYMETRIPQGNFGKVAKGQKVLLKMDAYPWQEFGVLTGEIDYISAIPADSGYYLARVRLPGKLVTNYQQPIHFKEGLKAHAEVITKDMRLAQRFVYDFIKQFRK